MTCHTCDGTGTVTRYRQDNASGPGTDDEGTTSPCHYCNGTGDLRAPRKWQPWTRRAALDFIRKLCAEIEPVGYHVALTGSVLTAGESAKDLDLIIYPRTTAHLDPKGLGGALMRCGLRRLAGRDRVQKTWMTGGSRDTKWVEVWTLDGERRVDLFFPWRPEPVPTPNCRAAYRPEGDDEGPWLTCGLKAAHEGGHK